MFSILQKWGAVTLLVLSVGMKTRPHWRRPGGTGQWEGEDRSPTGRQEVIRMEVEPKNDKNAPCSGEVASGLPMDSELSMYWLVSGASMPLILEIFIYLKVEPIYLSRSHGYHALRNDGKSVFINNIVHLMLQGKVTFIYFSESWVNSHR